MHFLDSPLQLRYLGLYSADLVHPFDARFSQLLIKILILSLQRSRYSFIFSYFPVYVSEKIVVSSTLFVCNLWDYLRLHSFPV